MRIKNLSLLLVLFFGLTSLSQEKTYEIEIKDDVKYIHNLKPKYDKPIVKLEFVQKIGELDPEDENYIFYRPWDVVEDSEGNIYLSDKNNHHIKKFSSDGQYLSTFGRRGEGPGEFNYPMALDIDLNDNIFVDDFGKVRFQILNSKGEFLNTFKISFINIFTFRLNSQRLIFVPYGMAATNADPLSSKGLKSKSIVGVFDQNGILLNEFGEPEKYDHPFITKLANNFFIEIDKYNNIYLSFMYNNRIDKYDKNGKHLFTATRKLNYEVKNEYTFEEGNKDIPYPKFTGVSGGIGIDNKNRLWIKSYKNQKSIKTREDIFFEIFSDTGYQLGRIKSPVKFGNMRIFGDRLYLIDAYEECCIYEYKIVDL